MDLPRAACGPWLTAARSRRVPWGQVPVPAHALPVATPGWCYAASSTGLGPRCPTESSTAMRRASHPTMGLYGEPEHRLPASRTRTRRGSGLLRDIQLDAVSIEDAGDLRRPGGYGRITPPYALAVQSPRFRFHPAMIRHGRAETSCLARSFTVQAFIYNVAEFVFRMPVSLSRFRRPAPCRWRVRRAADRHHPAATKGGQLAG